MYYPKLQALPTLAILIFLTISFFLAGAALAEGASVEVGEREIQTTHSFAASGSPLGYVIPESTSAATGSLTIADVIAGDIGPTFATISWETDEISDSLVRYGISTDSLNLTATSAVTGTAHSVGLVNLTPETQYFFEVESGVGVDDPVVDNNSGEFYSFTTSTAERNRKAFVGTVIGDPAETVTLSQNGNKGEVTIILPDDYILKTPGGPRSGRFEDGARVVVLSRSAAAQWVALQVLVKPVKRVPPVVGVITGVGPTSLTVLDHRGVPHFVQLGGGEGPLVEGEVVTVFLGNSGQTRGVVRAEAVRKRMQKFLDKTSAEESGENSEVEKARGKRAAALIKGLEKHGFERVRLLDAALDHVPAAVKEKIRSRRAAAQQGIATAEASVNKARGRFRLDKASTRGGDKSDTDRGNRHGSPGNTSSAGGKGKPDDRGSASGEGRDEKSDRGSRPDKKGGSNRK